MWFQKQLEQKHWISQYLMTKEPNSHSLLQGEGNKKDYLLRMDTYHFFQGSTSSKRTSEMGEAVNKWREKFIWNGS